MNRFADRTALITGGGHGIGRATALRLAQEGARVAIVDVQSASARETVELIRARGMPARAWTADVSDPDQVQATVNSVLDDLERIDVLHSNAGVLITGTALTQTVEDWDRIFAVNVRGMFLMARAVIPSMLATGGGAIVNTASTSGMVGEPALAAYNSSKAAVINLTRQLAADFSREGIRVNCICPGWIDTGFNQPILELVTDDQLAAMVDQWIPLGRQGTAEEIAAAVAFLASYDASYVSGHALVVDGGLTAI